MVATVNWQRGGIEINGTGDLHQVIEQADLDYRVEQVPLITDDDTRLSVRDRVANVRIDPDGERHVLGVVSKGYQVVHNFDALHGFNRIVEQAGATFTRAGVIDRGRIAYAFADLPEPVEILPGDPVKRSLMFTNSFDGSTPLGFVISPVRLWCSNQIAYARRKGYGFSIRHGANALDRSREATRLMGQTLRAFGQVTDHMKAMARVAMDTGRLQAYFEAIAPIPHEEARRPSILAKHEHWTRLFEGGIGNEGPRTRTLFHALNAVTEDVDHRELSRRVKDPVYYATFGAGGQLKQRAWAEAEKMLGVGLN